MEYRTKAKCFWAETLSPLLSGAGEGHGIADISLQRDSVMDIPKVDGSAIKGALKEAELFQENMRLSFSDLRLLFFPVKASHNLYALITCPFCLQRFRKEMLWYQYADEKFDKYIKQNCAFMPDNELRMWKTNEKFITLADKPYGISVFSEKNMENLFSSLGMQKGDIERIALVSDQDFKHFVQQETEIIQRIDVEKNYIFTEEYLPEKTILYGIVDIFPDLLDESHTSALSRIENKQAIELHLGKNNTLGKGWIRLREIGA